MAELPKESPFKQAELTALQKETVEKHFREKPLGNCSVCGQRKWQIDPSLLELRPFSGGNFLLGGPIYPMLAVICNICFHTVFFNAVRMGVLKNEPNKEGSTDV